MSRAFDTLKRLVEGITARVDYHVLYAGTVLAQAADGTVDVRLDSTKMPGVSGVKIRHGLPGFTCVVPSGARVLVGFEDGSPAKPYVALWESGSVTSVTFDGGTKSVARVDDTVGCGAVTATAGGGPVTFTYTPQGGGTPVVSPTLSIEGVITSGNTKLKA